MLATALTVGVFIYFLYHRHPAKFSRVNALKSCSLNLKGFYRRFETVAPDSYPPFFAYSPARLTNIRVYNSIELSAHEGEFKFFDCRAFNDLYGGYISMIKITMRRRKTPYFLLSKDKFSHLRLLKNKIKYYGLYATQVNIVENIFDQSLIDFINESPKFDVEGYGDTLIVYDPNYKISPHDVADMFGWCRQFVSLLENSQHHSQMYCVV